MCASASIRDSKYTIYVEVYSVYINPLLFIRGLSCPNCIQASLSLNCLKLTIPGFPHNCLPVSCGEIGLLKRS
jgi:hypothetical protein